MKVETYREVYRSVYGTVEFPKAMIRVDFINPTSSLIVFETAADAFVEESAA